MNTSQKEKILKIRGKDHHQLMDSMVEEHRVTLIFNGEKMMSLMCSPSALKELAVGFFYIKGMIKSFEDLEKVVIHQEVEKSKIEVWTKNKKTKVNIPNFFELSEENTCFHPQLTKKEVREENIETAFEKTLEKYEMTQERISEMMRRFSCKSELFLSTGGVHSIGLYKKGEPILFYDDVSRYNTYNKLFGGMLLHAIPLEDKMLLTTGRLPQEVMSWIIHQGIGCILSISAPTRGSVLLAREKNIALMGFVRGESFNFYSPILNNF